MDETIAEWVIEYLLRRRIDEISINSVISSLNLVINNYRLKKTMLLRGIETETSNGCVSEKILELIEKIEELDREKGKTASDLIKEAYCLVGVDCTVRFLVENGEENVKYMEMVEIVWRNRVCKSERLVSGSSKRWFDDIEAAVKDSDVFWKIWKRNTRNEALKAVKDYLKEGWECLGPPFLESIFENEMEGCFDGDHGVLCYGNGLRHEIVGCTRKDKTLDKQKHVAAMNKCHRGANISDADMDAMNKAGEGTTEMVTAGIVTPSVGRADKPIRPSSTELPAPGEHLSEDIQTAQTLASMGPVGNNGVIEPDQTRSKILESCEVARGERALKDDTRELHAAVSDPFPEDLQTVQEMAQKMETDMGNGVLKQAETKLDVLKGSNENDPGNVNKNIHNEDFRGHEILDDGIQKNVRKRSLMEPNETSCNHEWDDEIENTIPGSPSRHKLPSPKVHRSSPLKRPEYRNLLGRRVRKKWDPSEEDTLREGVQKYGKGNWKSILNDARFGEVFKGRTEVDLKDKWRNLLKYSS